MTLLILGLIVFIGIHLIPTVPALRNRLAAQVGEGTYKGLFSLASVASLVLLVYGFSQRDFVPVWTPPTGMKHLVMTLMLPAFILMVAAYVPSRIRTYVRHPFLLAVKLWAFAHLLANGDLAGILLFGSFLAYAVYDLISVKRRGALGPIGDKAGNLSGDIAAVIAGVAIYAVTLVYAHEWLIGIPLL